MSKPESKLRNEIPESLHLQLGEFRLHLWRRKIIESVAAGLIGLLVSFLLVFALDRIFQTSSWVRLVILLSGISLLGIFVPYWLYRWVWKARSEQQLAKLISKKFPDLGDRLLGIIELEARDDRDENSSSRLRLAAMDVVAKEAAKRDLDLALPMARHIKWGGLALFLSVVSIGAFFITPQAGLNALHRWLSPFSDVERYTFTQIVDFPKSLAVPYGEPFDTRFILSKRSDKRPLQAFAKLGNQEKLNAPLSGESYIFTFPGQQEKSRVDIRIGDYQHSFWVDPVQRPSVMNTRAKITPPAYMGLPVQTVDMNTGVLTVVEGSEVIFELDMSRELTSGNFSLIQKEATHRVKASPLEINSTNAQTQSISVKRGAVEIPFSWIDKLGLGGGSDFRMRIEGVKDATPVSYIQGIERQKAILPEETIDFEILCEDDFGLKEAGIEWRNVLTLPGEVSTVKGDLTLSEQAITERRILKPVAFSPAAFGIGPQRIEVRAFSEDFFPERGRVYSEPITLYVLTREEHAQLLKSQFDRLIGELEDLSRRELNLLDENQRLGQSAPEELDTEAGRKQLAAQEQAETESSQRMEGLKQKMEDIMKGATRNGELDKQTMKKMAEALQPMQELADQDIPDVRDTLRDSQDPGNAPEKKQSYVNEAVQKQKQVMQKLADALDKASDANKRFEASTFVSRLKKAADEQNAIAKGLIDSFSRKLLGQRVNELSPSEQMRLAEATKQQQFISADVRWIQEDLGYYFARVANADFKNVMESMKQSKIDQGLESVRSKLEKHHSFTATEGAKKWADQLRNWADELAKKMDDKDPGSGGGSGAPNSEEEDFEFMLRVMKMIQQQQDVRSKTRVLEQLKRDSLPSATD